MKILTDEEVILIITHCYNEADERFCEICPLRKECLYYYTGEKCDSCLEKSEV